MPTGVYKRTEETRKKMSETRKRIQLSEETKRKMSLAKSGPNNPNYGKHPSDKARKKQSEANKAGARNLMYGRHHTEESKKKMSLACKKTLDKHTLKK